MVGLPSNVKPICLKWLYKVNKGVVGTRHKARLVAKGYVQIYEFNFEVFVYAARMETVRLILDMLAELNKNVHKLDVKAAFLNGVLKDDLYVMQPQGYEIK